MHIIRIRGVVRYAVCASYTLNGVWKKKITLLWELIMQGRQFVVGAVFGAEVCQAVDDLVAHLRCRGEHGLAYMDILKFIQKVAELQVLYQPAQHDASARVGRDQI